MEKAPPMIQEHCAPGRVILLAKYMGDSMSDASIFLRFIWTFAHNNIVGNTQSQWIIFYP
jgi:hypothetical protein